MMGSLHILLPLLAAAALIAPACAEPQCAAYAGELTAMVEAAEAVRSRIDYLASPGDPAAGEPAAVQGRTELEAVERGNAERLAAWMNACGWPRRSVEGVQAARGAWLVAQQRSGDLPFQRQVVRQLELAVLDGEAPAMYLATASDRLAVKEGRPQRYGTQLRQVDACHWDYYLLDDPQRVEARRKRLGLPSLEKHKRGINDAVASENCPAAQPIAALPGR
jgi:hypothetical protein